VSLEHGLGVPAGCRPAEWRSCLTVDPQLARLRGLGLAEWRSCMCQSPVWQALGAWPRGTEMLCLYLWHGTPWGHVPAEQRSCRAVPALVGGMASMAEIGPSEMEVLQGCASLGVMAQQNGDGACLYLCSRPWGHGPGEAEIYRAGDTTQRNRAPAGLCTPWGHGPAEIMLGCAGLGGRGLVKILNVCGSPALRADPTEILQF
jgi:hypothetical protein